MLGEGVLGEFPLGESGSTGEYNGAVVSETSSTIAGHLNGVFAGRLVSEADSTLAGTIAAGALGRVVTESDSLRPGTVIRTGGGHLSELDTVRPGMYNRTIPGSVVSELSELGAGILTYTSRVATEYDEILAGSYVDETGASFIGGRVVAESDAVLPGAQGATGDDQSAPISIDGIEDEITLDLTGATVAVDDDAPVGTVGTVWLSWDVPADAESVRFTLREAEEGVNAALTLYRPAEAGPPVEVATGTDVRVAIEDTDESFLIMVSDLGGDPVVLVNWLDGSPPVNDDFANALEIDNLYGSDVLDFTNSTTETDEPLPVGKTHSVWATFSPDQTGNLTIDIDTEDAAGSFTLTAYRGDSLASLVSVDATTGTELNFQASSSYTYYIQITGDDDYGQVGVSWFADPVIVEPEDDVEYIRIEAYKPDGTTVLTEIPRRFGIRFNDPLNQSGMGQLQILADDPILDAYPDLFEWRNIIKFFIGGRCIQGFRIQERDVTLVHSDEHSALVRTISGPTVQFLLEDFMVRHDGPPRPDSQTTRSYSWASMRDEWYHSSDWDDPVTSASMSDPPGSGAKKHQPKGWPDKSARWVYVGNDFHARPKHGRKYYRRNFTLGKKTHVRLFATADESYRVYVDGEEVLSADNVETGYTNFDQIDLMLPRGKHTVAAFAKGTASYKGDGNDSLLVSMMRVNVKGKATSVVVHTDNSWEAYYGLHVPGWNRAQVLRNCVREARDRGNDSASQLTLGFGPTHDSAGRKWTDRWSDDVQIGDSALALQGKLSEGNGFDVWVDPATLTIHAYKRRGVDKSHSVTFEPGRNLLEWTSKETDDSKNVFLMNYEGGWTTWTDNASRRIHGRREAFVSLGNSKDDQDAQRVMKGVSKGIGSAIRRAGTGDLRTRSKDQPEGGLIAVPGARPFLDFRTGDTVKAPNAAGKLTAHRVLDIACTEDQDGRVSYDPSVEEVLGS